MNAPSITRIGAVGFVLLAAASVAGRVRASHNLNNARCGSYCAREIALKSQPLITALSGKRDIDSVMAMPMLSGDKEGANKHRWLIDATDSVDRFQIHLVWDADKDKLISASHSVPTAPRFAVHPLSRKRAEAITSAWLTTLGMLESSDDWKPDAEAVHNGYIWRIEWKSKKQAIAVTIDANDGAFVIAQTVSPSDPARATASLVASANRKVASL